MKARPWTKYDTRLRRRQKHYDRLFDSGPAGADKVLRWTRFAAWLSDDPAPPPLISVTTADLPVPATAPGPFVIIQPFSAVPAKQPSVRIFRAIIDALPTEMSVVLTGTEEDLRRSPQFRELLTLPGVSFDASTFYDLVATLRAATLVISVDTALMHLAVVLGAPTLCLASAAYVGEIVPYAAEITPPNVRFLYHDMPCRGCLGNCIHPLEDGRYACVQGLSAATVVSCVRDFLHHGSWHTGPHRRPTGAP